MSISCLLQQTSTYKDFRLSSELVSHSKSIQQGGTLTTDLCKHFKKRNQLNVSRKYSLCESNIFTVVFGTTELILPSIIHTLLSVINCILVSSIFIYHRNVIINMHVTHHYFNMPCFKCY